MISTPPGSPIHRVATAMAERALCLACIARRAGMRMADTNGVLERISTGIAITMTANGCDDCGEPIPVFTLSALARE